MKKLIIIAILLTSIIFVIARTDKHEEQCEIIDTVEDIHGNDSVFRYSVEDVYVFKGFKNDYIIRIRLDDTIHKVEKGYHSCIIE